MMLTRISFSTKWGEIADNAHIQIRNVSSADAFSPDRGFYKILAETLRKGIEDGEFKPGLSVEVTVNTVNYIITGFDTHWALANREFDINEAA